jgi:hypothetical protein
MVGLVDEKPREIGTMPPLNLRQMSHVDAQADHSRVLIDPIYDVFGSASSGAGLASFLPQRPRVFVLFRFRVSLPSPHEFVKSVTKKQTEFRSPLHAISTAAAIIGPKSVHIAVAV